MTDTYMLRIQQRKDLYEDVYQQVLQGCEGSASQEGVEALQREAQAVRDIWHVACMLPPWLWCCTARWLMGVRSPHT